MKLAGRRASGGGGEQVKADNRKVIILGQVCYWRDKEPFVPSGKSIRGALEYDSKTDRVRCHECGGWFESVGDHLKSHDIAARDYKLKHGLRKKAGLCGQKRHLRMRSHAIRYLSGNYGFKRGHKIRRLTTLRALSETRNLRGCCHAQLLAKIKRISVDLGHTPTRTELKANGVLGEGPHSCSFEDLFREAGLKPNPASPGRQDLYSKEILIELLRDFFVLNDRCPNSRDWRSGLIPTRSTYVKWFGSLANAYKETGLLRVAIADGNLRLENKRRTA